MRQLFFAFMLAGCSHAPGGDTPVYVEEVPDMTAVDSTDAASKPTSCHVQDMAKSPDLSAKPDMLKCSGSRRPYDPDQDHSEDKDGEHDIK